MKNIFLIAASALSINLSAQIKFETGDAELDLDLNEINVSAKADLDGFKADLTATFGVTPKNLDYMISINMEPAEMYFALEISVAVNKPIETVIDTYETHRDKGWGYIAQELGIKPGSPEFHALKDKSKAKKEKVAKGNSNAGGNSGNGNGNGKISTTKRQK